MLRHTVLLSSAFLSIVLLSACSGMPVKYKQPQVVADPDKVSAQLAQAADKASNALQTLAAIEQTRTPNASIAPPDNVPVELRRGITINWVGPAEDIIKTVANRASYRFSELGERPPNSLIVTLDVENKPIIDVLRSIGLQLGTKADIVVDANSRSVEMRYHSITDPTSSY